MPLLVRSASEGGPYMASKVFDDADEMFWFFCLSLVERANGVIRRSRSVKGRRTSMSFRRVSGYRGLWFGTMGLAAMLFGGVGRCKAQEVNPAIFTDNGVEDAYPAKKATPKKMVKTEKAAPAHQAAAATAQKRKAHHPARKRNVTTAPSV